MYSVSSLLLLADCAGPGAKRIVAAINAMRGECFAATFEVGDSGITQTNAPVILGEALLVEYAALGGLAGLTGVLLSVGGAWALSRFVFQVEFVLPVTIIVVSLGTVSLLTMAIGWFGSRGVLDEPPLVILREA